jgi:hypothetical protein
VQLSRAIGCQPTPVKAALDNKLEAPKARVRHMAIDDNLLDASHSEDRFWILLYR